MTSPSSPTTITLPHQYKCRKYQEAFWRAAQKGFKRFVLVWHRRAGKEKTCWNYLIMQAVRKVGIYYYFFPHFSQGRKILWDGVDKQGFKLLDHIPKDIIEGQPNSTEMKVKLKNGSLIQVIGTNNVDCYDDQTEILSESGWKLFKDLLLDDRVATLEDRCLVYARPSAFVCHRYDGPMVKVLNSSTDILVTPNHKFFVCSGKGFYKFKTAAQLSLRNDRIPSSCRWEGRQDSIFNFPPIKNEWICGKGRVVKREWNRSLPMCYFVALLGIFLSEGCTYSDHKTYRICISQKKEETRREIFELLEKIGINYQVNANNVTFEDKQMYGYFSQFGLCHEKFIPDDIKALATPYLKILFDWMVKGDGSMQDGVVSYFSTSKRLIDDFQEVCIKLGLGGSVSVKPQKDCYIKGRLIKSENCRTLYVLQVRSSKWKSFANNERSYVSERMYAGNVYCVTVPSGVVKVRRNGKEAWCGNSVVGTNPIGCVFTEYSLQDPKAWQLIRPILAENGGWAVFNFTPRGSNHAKELYDMALGNPSWFCQRLTADDTGAITPEAIQAERDAGMSEDFIQQEFFCSFTLGVEGSYYAKYIQEAKDEERIGIVPWNKQSRVYTAWDIGYGDSTAIIFYQLAGQEIHIIDYYENHGEGLPHYAGILQAKGYTYASHFAPHDIESHSFSSGLSAQEVGAELGIRFTTLPTLKLRLEDGIEAVRGIFPRVWMDAEKCKGLIKCLENYRKEFDDRLEVYKNRPLHDRYSHGADSFRYMSLAIKRFVDTGKASGMIDDSQSEKWFKQFNPVFE